MISCRNLSGRYTHTCVGSIRIKPPEHVSRVGTESVHRPGLLTCGAFVRLRNYFEQHSKQWRWGWESYVFMIMQSEMTAPNE